MKKTITRRDFLNGAALALAAGGTLSPNRLLAMEEKSGATNANKLAQKYYPPSLTGLRGSHVGSFEVAHDMAWRGKKPEGYTALDEDYDLVIVGGGISGLASAYFYRQQAGFDKKILILDNHDDFGGHAKRNEFQIGDRTLLGAGGSVNLETTSFSDTVNRVMEELGVDLDKLHAAREPDYMLSDLNAESGYFLNKSEYGQNKIVQGNWGSAWNGDEESLQLLADLGLPDEQYRKLLTLVEGDIDLLDDLSLLEAKHYTETRSYETFLRERAGLSIKTIKLFEPFNKIFMGTSCEAVSVQDAILLGYPGGNSIGYTGKLLTKMLTMAKEQIRFPIFPDGNASIARLLVRRLIPRVAPGDSMDDILDARFDYGQLDRSDSPIRVRLNSTAVNVKNVDGGVEVDYVQAGIAYKVRGKSSILACYNGIIPHLCPELPEAQKEHLKYGVKVPLVMTNVLLRSGAAVNASGPAQYHCPGSYYSVVTKAPPVSLGNYQDNSDGSNPLVLWMCHSPAPKGTGQQNSRDLYRLGRHRLYQTPFSAYELEVKQQLTAMFGAKGFDADRDIEAITVNRWSHGYSYAYNTLFDPKWEEGQTPHELGRAPIGRISIANSDSEAAAYLHSAIDAAARAVEELTT